MTLTEEIEIRTTTDEEGNEEEYEYRILNVKLTNKPIASLAEELLNSQQFEMFKVYLQTQGNKPLIFGGGSPDGSPSEDLSGVEFVNGTVPETRSLWSLQSSKSEMWAATLTGLGTALTAAWNGAPVSFHGATIKPEKVNPALRAANGRVSLGSSQGGNGARGVMKISHRATLSFSTGI